MTPSIFFHPDGFASVIDYKGEKHHIEIKEDDDMDKCFYLMHSPEEHRKANESCK